MGYDVTVRQFMFTQVSSDKYGVQLDNCDVLLLPGWRLFSHDLVAQNASFDGSYDFAILGMLSRSLGRVSTVV